MFLEEVKTECTYFCYRTIADLSNAKNNRWVNLNWTPLIYHTNSNIIIIEPSPKIGKKKKRKKYWNITLVNSISNPFFSLNENTNNE